MMIWVAEFRGALEREFGDQPPVAALATVDQSGHPRARSVVCRQIEDDGTTWYTSDARSAKSGQLRSEPRAEAVFWLPMILEQYRISGCVDIILPGDADDVRTHAWNTLSSASRALFFWPDPGGPLEPDISRFPAKISAGFDPPDTFELLVLVPTTAERLALREHPHLRVRYSANAHWAPETLNP